jgi:NADH-quinone oxidoreductase subunit N
MFKLTFNALLLLLPVSLIFTPVAISTVFVYSPRYLNYTKNISILCGTTIPTVMSNICPIQKFASKHFVISLTNIIIIVTIFLATWFTCYSIFNVVFVMEEILVFVSALIPAIFATSATNLLTLFICFESFNICFFTLLASNANEIRTLEAALQYIFVSMIASLIYLLGTFFIYCDVMSLYLVDIALFNTYDSLIYNYNPICNTGIFLIIVSIFIKLGIFPFYNWMVKVYSNLSTKALILAIVVIKTVFSMILLVVLAETNVLVNMNLRFLFVTGGFGSLIVSCGYLLVESKTKRFLAFSSLLSTGFMCLFLYPAITEFTYVTTLNYIVIQGFSLLFLLSFLTLSKCPTGLPVSINFRNYSEINFVYLTFLILSPFSLMGIPPFPGFFPKLAILYYLYNNGFNFILTIFLISTVIVAFCLIRPILKASHSGEMTGFTQTISFSKQRNLIISFLFFTFFFLILFINIFNT